MYTLKPNSVHLLIVLQSASAMLLVSSSGFVFSYAPVFEGNQILDNHKHFELISEMEIKSNIYVKFNIMIIKQNF